MTVQHAFAAVAALALISEPTFARPTRTDDQAPRQVAVSYADLKLETPAGQAELMGRIHHAAETVCGPSPDLHEVKAVMAFKRCMKQSVDTAVASIPTASQLAEVVRPAG